MNRQGSEDHDSFFASVTGAVEKSKRTLFNNLLWCHAALDG